MDRKIVIVLAIVVVFAILIGLIVISPHPGKEASEIKFLNTNSTLKNGDAVKFRLSDFNGNPISGQEIVISLTNGDMNSNYSITTDNSGQGTLVLSDLSPGEYTIVVSYSGNDKYNSSNAMQKINITENNSAQQVKVENTTSQQSDYNSSTDSSSQSQSQSSSSATNGSLNYDSELNLYYDNQGIVVGGIGDGEKYEDLVKQAETINEKGLN